MPSMPDRQAQAQPIPASSPMPRTECASTAAEAVAEILACADVAVGAIGRQAEAQVREMTERAEARPAEEAMRRQVHLEQLRHELAERAAALAFSYNSILEELGAIDRMLAGEADGLAGQGEVESDPRLASIRMTLRERRRVHPAGEASDMPAAPWVEPVAEAAGAEQSTQEVWRLQAATQWQESQPAAEPWPPVAATPAPAAAPQYVQPEVQPQRRSWRLWKRAA